MTLTWKEWRLESAIACLLILHLLHKSEHLLLHLFCRLWWLLSISMSACCCWMRCVFGNTVVAPLVSVVNVGPLLSGDWPSAIDANSRSNMLMSYWPLPDDGGTMSPGPLFDVIFREMPGFGERSEWEELGELMSLGFRPCKWCCCCSKKRANCDYRSCADAVAEFSQYVQQTHVHVVRVRSRRYWGKILVGISCCCFCGWCFVIGWPGANRSLLKSEIIKIK